MPVARNAFRIPLSLLAVCSALVPATSAEAKDKTSPMKQTPSQVGSVDGAGTYALSAEEMGYDCKRLAGRMQVRLLEARAYNPAKDAPSAFSAAVRGAAEPVAGVLLGTSSSRGADREKQHADDIAMLRAYNARLAAKGCRTYNLDAELKAGAKAPLPAARRPDAGQKP